MEGLLTKLLDRLETVTQRLEKVEKHIASGNVGGGSAGAGSAPAASAGAGGASSPFVEAFERLVADHVVGFVEASKKLGDELPQLAGLVEQALDEHKKLLTIASQSKKPSDSDFQKLVAGQVGAAGKIGELKDKARKTKFPNNLAAVSEGIGALNWVAVTPTPAPFIGDMIGGSEFYSNRILKDFKGKDENQVAFVTGFNGFLKELQKYVKQFHTTGLSWNNAKGGNALEVAASLGGSSPSGGAAPPPPAGGPPPPGPPPPGPPPPAATTKAGDVDPSAAVSAVFSQINSGNVTSGLRKVTKDMKSKNQPGYSGAVTVAAPKKAAAPAAKAVAKKGPAKTELQGNKWMVENHDGGEHVIDATDFKQTVYIYKTDNAVIRINNKINAVTLDSCKKTSVVFDNAIASLEIVNCNSVRVQITIKVPSITVDKTSGCILYLSKDGLDTEIYTSKSDEMNVVIPNPTEGEDPIETPIPEQFLTKVKDRKTLVTETVKHTGV